MSSFLTEEYARLERQLLQRGTPADRARRLAAEEIDAIEREAASRIERSTYGSSEDAIREVVVQRRARREPRGNPPASTTRRSLDPASLAIERVREAVLEPIDDFMRAIETAPAPVVVHVPTSRGSPEAVDVRNFAGALRRGAPGAFVAFTTSLAEAVSTRLAQAGPRIAPGLVRLGSGLGTDSGQEAFHIGIAVGLIEGLDALVRIPDQVERLVQTVLDLLPDLLRTLDDDELVELARRAGHEQGRGLVEPWLDVLTGHRCAVPTWLVHFGSRRLGGRLDRIARANCQAFEFGRLLAPLIAEVIVELLVALATEGAGAVVAASARLVRPAGRAGSATIDLARGMIRRLPGPRRSAAARNLSDLFDPSAPVRPVGRVDAPNASLGNPVRPDLDGPTGATSPAAPATSPQPVPPPAAPARPRPVSPFSRSYPVLQGPRAKIARHPNPRGRRYDRLTGDTARTGGIREISAAYLPGEGRAVEVRLVGELRPGLEGRGDGLLPNYNRSDTHLRSGSDLVVEGVRLSDYEKAHLWGPRFGDEARDGMMYAPSDLNQVWQSGQGIERLLGDVRDQVAALGGRVELVATARSFPRNRMRGLRGRELLLKEVEYDIRLVPPDGDSPVITIFRASVEVDHPSAGGRVHSPLIVRGPAWQSFFSP